jgi:hypothetical protein
VPNVDAMLRGMSAKQYLEWRRFAEVEPFEEWRSDVRAGAIICALFELQRDRKKKSEPYELDECTPKFGDAVRKLPPVKDWRVMKAQMQLALGAGDKLKKKTAKKTAKKGTS